MADSQDNTVRLVPFFAPELDALRDILYAIFKLDGGNRLSCQILLHEMKRHVNSNKQLSFTCPESEFLELENTRKNPADVNDGDNGMTMISFVSNKVLVNLDDLASSATRLILDPEGGHEYSIRMLRAAYHAIVRDFILHSDYMYPDCALKKFWKTAVRDADKGKDGES